MFKLGFLYAQSLISKKFLMNEHELVVERFLCLISSLIESTAIRIGGVFEYLVK